MQLHLAQILSTVNIFVAIQESAPESIQAHSGSVQPQTKKDWKKTHI